MSCKIQFAHCICRQTRYKGINTLCKQSNSGEIISAAFSKFNGNNNILGVSQEYFSKGQGSIKWCTHDSSWETLEFIGCTK